MVALAERREILREGEFGRRQEESGTRGAATERRSHEEKGDGVATLPSGGGGWELEIRLGLVRGKCCGGLWPVGIIDGLVAQWGSGLAIHGACHGPLGVPPPWPSPGLPDRPCRPMARARLCWHRAKIGRAMCRPFSPTHLARGDYI